MNTEHERLAQELGNTWDGVVRGEQSVTSDPASASIIQQLTAEHNATRISAATEDAIWASVLAGAVSAIEAADLAQQPPVAMRMSSSDTWIRMLSRVHRFAWILVAGLVGGFIAGVGARLFMRVSGVLTVDRNRFMLTENDARVGELTLDGTMSLGLVGAALGVFALIFYVLIRDRLPFSGWQRSAVFSWILLLVFGYVVMDPGNPDYQSFGPAWLNVVTFSSLYLVMGFAVTMIYEAGLRSEETHSWFASNRWFATLRTVLSVALCLIGLMAMMSALFVGAAGLLIPLIAFVTWVIGRLVDPEWVAKLRMPMLVRHWGTWVIPGLVGFILTARGITVILMN